MSMPQLTSLGDQELADCRVAPLVALPAARQIQVHQLNSWAPVDLYKALIGAPCFPWLRWLIFPRGHYV